MMNYDEAIEKLTSAGMFRIELGLDRIRAALELLGNPQDNLKCIHVAGTNGKGSVCAMLDSVLREQGYKIGLYTSPHIYEYTERIRVSGEEISKTDFAKLFELVLNKSQKAGISLTEFEILTAMMFVYFNEKKVDYAIIETGMGGRFDATNVIKTNLCAIITQIDLDHTDRLGTTKDEIAYEKAGIIKPECPVITSMGYEAIRDKADELNSLLVFTSPYVNQEFISALSLKGLHQAENLALVLSTLDLLFKEISANTIKSGLSKVHNPCRFEFFKDKNLIADASHNPNGIKALRENLDYFYPNTPRRFVFGCLKTKDYRKMAQILFRDTDEIYLYDFNPPLSVSYDELCAVCPKGAKKYNPDVNLTPEKLNIICGSFYMFGKISF